MFKKITLLLMVAFSSNVFALDAYETEWSKKTRVVNISAYSEGEAALVAIGFADEEIKNPAKCRKNDFYGIHSGEGKYLVGQSLVSMAIAAGAANLSVQYKVHRRTCLDGRPLVSELKVNF